MTSHPSVTPFTGARYRNLAILLAALSALGPFSIDTYLPSFPEIAETLKASPLQVQQTLTAYLLPFSLMTLWHGAISDAIGRRRMVLIALVLFMCASVGCALSRSIEMLWCFRALQGIVAGAGMVVVRAVVRDLFDGPDAHRLLAHISIMFAVAPAIAPIIGGWLHVLWGWRSVFVFMGLFAASMALWAFFSLPETLPAPKRQRLNPKFLAKSYWRVLTNPAFVPVCLALGLNFSGIFVYIASAPVFLLKHLHVSETQFFWLFGPTTAGMMAGSWLSSRLAGRISVRQMLQRGYALMVIAAVTNLLFHQFSPARLPWSVAPLCVYGMGMALTMPSLTLLGLDLFPAQKGLAASCQSFVQTCTNTLTAAIIAPAVCGSPLTLAGAQMALLCLGVAATLAYAIASARSRTKLFPRE